MTGAAAGDAVRIGLLGTSTVATYAMIAPARAGLSAAGSPRAETIRSRQ